MSMSRQERNKERNKRSHDDDDFQESHSTRKKKNKRSNIRGLIDNEDFSVVETPPLRDDELDTPDTAYELGEISFTQKKEPDFGSTPKPPVEPASSNTSHEPHKNTSITEKMLTARELPAEIQTIFPNMKSHGTLMKQLFDIQTNEDAYGRRTTKNRQRSLPRQAVIEYFKTSCSLDVDSNEGKQIMNYLKNPILQHAIYGILLYNSAREIFIVFDSRNYWNAPATYRKIENLRLETIKETAIRAFNEQISVTNRDDNQVVDNYIINDKHQLGLDNYVEYQFDNLPWGEMARTIGLFAIKVDKTKIDFKLKDKYQYRNGKWFTFDTILKMKRKNKNSQFDRLKPFVEWLRNYLLFNNELS